MISEASIYLFTSKNCKKGLLSKLLDVLKIAYMNIWSTQSGLQNTLNASLQRGKTRPLSILDMTLTNLMVRLQ